MKDVRTVIWDCDGVMWFHKKEEPQIISESLHIPYSQNFYEEFWAMIREFNSYFADKKATMGQFYRIIEEKMPILYLHGVSPTEFVESWNGLKTEINQFNEESLITMEYLYNKGLKCIIKSDFWRDVQVGMLKEWGMLKYIERLYCCDNAYLKCNPLSAEEVIKPGTENEYIIIGDSPTSDLAFANHSGIKSIWFNKGGEKENKTPYKPDFEVSSLLEVMNIL